MQGVFIIVLLVGLLFSSCGYKFTCKAKLPYDVESIYVNMIENHTEEVGLESQFTNGIIRQFQHHISKGIVCEKHADAIITGDIISFYIDNLSYNPSVELSDIRRRIVMIVELSLESPEGLTLWRSGYIRESHYYNFVSESSNVSRKNKEKAIAVLIDKLSASAFRMLTKRF